MTIRSFLINKQQQKQDRLIASDLHVEYESSRVFESLNIVIPDGKFSVIIGPNGCGKSTLLRTLCRLLTPHIGQVTLDGKNIAFWPAKELARQVGILPQNVQAPDGIRVVDLVARGRYPYQRLFQQWSPDDEIAVKEALEVTGIEHLAERQVEELSGGQRQRAWIAMVLAQKTPILFLDEPTTYLDIAHQIELLELLSELNREKGYTIVAILHDLNQACRYADHMLVMADGAIHAEGKPDDIMSAEMVRHVFNLECSIISDPVSNTPLAIPHGRWGKSFNS